MSAPIAYDAIAIIFLVSDLERTRRFYRDALGIELAAQDGFLLGKLAGAELLFFQGEPKPGTSPQIVFGLQHGGIDTLAQQLANQGVQLLTPVSEAPGGWSIEFADPDQHRLAFFHLASLPRART